ncbi:winged helix-turn-helix transcriptional regulator [Nocardioides sp. JQ2195]|uniref:MarR family winged helix-turn-helix transcriptional regulator n=1 Tax=Nocardioides sp. JQ2195 TaxID=2592334 RepID=UPI00143E7A33|nr:MarR family winged helix-turn-helix transcriptional regulator [Nocardioides sp. JQ2195]QIX27268.1 winged helix-turn-helix transcriptional regulator [Nocardioides sp. JQ2195]
MSEDVTDRFRDIEFETMLLGRHLSPVRRAADGESYLDRSAYTLLTRLQAQGPMSIGQLSEAFGLDASTLNRQTAAMMRSGLVERIPDPDGGLARKFLVTEAGSKKLDAERASNVTGLQNVLQDWSPEDVAALATLLTRFNEVIERREGRSWPRSRP